MEPGNPAEGLLLGHSPGNGLNLSWVIWIPIPGWIQDLEPGRGIAPWRTQPCSRTQLLLRWDGDSSPALGGFFSRKVTLSPILCCHHLRPSQNISSCPSEGHFAEGIGSRFTLLKESGGRGVRTLRNAFDVVLKAELLSELFYVKGKKIQDKPEYFS